LRPSRRSVAQPSIPVKARRIPIWKTSCATRKDIAMASRFDDVLVHESACVDEPVKIGAGTKIWHFVHNLAGCEIGINCIFGQNVMVGPNVKIGDRLQDSE
jgi:UDP-3-O-[3-hydroxymyristoyl] glucosamine N-acyltransferase